MGKQLWKLIVGMDEWSLIWMQRQHCQAVVAQAWCLLLACLASTTRGGGNRGNGKMLHYCSCQGGSTGPAFIVSLLAIDNKRGGDRGNRGNITRLQQGCNVIVAVVGGAAQTRHLLLACLASRTEWAATGPTGALQSWLQTKLTHTTYAHSGKVVRLVLSFWRQMHWVIQNGELFFLAINMLCVPYHKSKTHKLDNFSVLPAQVKNRARQGFWVPLGASP